MKKLVSLPIPIMALVIIVTIVGYQQQSNLWPIYLILVSPMAVLFVGTVWAIGFFAAKKKEGDQAMEDKERPMGLIVLAAINFIFAFFSLIGLLALLLPQVLEQMGIPITPYSILSPILTGALLIISGIGFIKVDYKLGFIGGNIFGAHALVNIMMGSVILGKGLFFHIPSMIYPIVLLLLLNLRYKKYFAESK